MRHIVAAFHVARLVGVCARRRHALVSDMGTRQLAVWHPIQLATARGSSKCSAGMSLPGQLDGFQRHAGVCRHGQ